MTVIAYYDIETNGLLRRKREKDGSWHPPMDRVHMVTIILEDTSQPGWERKISAADQPGYVLGETGRGWERMPIVDSLKILADADLRVAHNGMDFDERAIPKVYPWWKPKAGSMLHDTLLLSRLIYPDIFKSGPNNHRLFPFEKGLHGLASWGKRLGCHKGDYKGGWMHWSEEMGAYGEQDTIVLQKLYKWLMAQKPAPESVALEHDFAAVIRRQESYGVAFNIEKAHALLAKLTTRETILEAELIEDFGSWWDFGKKVDVKAADHTKDTYGEEFEDEDEEDEEEQARRRALFYGNQEYGEVIIPTKTRKMKMVGFPDVEHKRFSAATGKPLKSAWGPPVMEFTQGHPYTPVKRKEFNPSSRPHIFKRLIAKYGWEPVKFTPGGKKSPPQPKVDEDVLKGLPYPEAQKLAEYMLVLKRLGQLAVGKKAWLKVADETVAPNGVSSWRIHARVNTNGAVTGRCTHSDPNLAQVPKNSAASTQYPEQDYLHGYACRDLFEASPGMTLVGFDGAALELRMLAHFISPWDGGEYAKIVDEGRKEDGTDPHSWLRDLIGADLLGGIQQGRDNAKTVMYADLYGAGNLKIGSIVIPHSSDKEKMELGKEIKAKMASRFTAKAKLQEALTEAVEARGHLIGLDGRKLPVRKAHAALNTLLQSAGALVMKKSLVVLDRGLQRAGMIPGIQYEFVLNIHDEAQAEVQPDLVPLYMETAEGSLPKVGKLWRMKCPLKAEAEAGSSWAHTH